MVDDRLNREKELDDGSVRVTVERRVRGTVRVDGTLDRVLGRVERWNERDPDERLLDDGRRKLLDELRLDPKVDRPKLREEGRLD